MERSTIFNGKIHYFDWAMASSSLFVCKNQAGYSMLVEPWSPRKTSSTRPGYDIHSLPCFFDGPLIYRWLTVLNSMVDLSMAKCECHNQMVIDRLKQNKVGWCT